MQNLSNQRDHEADEPDGGLPQGSYRIGGVSRLSGVPVPTLRVWEARYAAFTPAKSSGRHRLYVEGDVVKARLMRQLTAAGHSVGAIARLPIGELQRVLAGTDAQAVPARAAAPRLTAVVVGTAMAARINSPGWRQRHGGEPLDVRHVFATLEEALDGEEAAQALPDQQAELLLVRLNAVQVDTYRKLTQAIARHRVQRTVVLYNFGAEPLLEAMRAAGMTVRREPVPDAEFAELLRSVKVVDAAGSMSAFGAGGAIPPRRYSEATLARVASSPNSILCECPRHIADLIGQLASFEEYSAQCLNNSAEDARVHAYLRSISGSARALFEHALQLVAGHAGLALEEDGARPAQP